MTTSFYNRVKYNATSSGTGSFVTGSGITGFLTPATASVTNGATVSYTAESADQSQWETGTGVYTSATHTLTRTVRESSNANALVNFSAAPVVRLDLLAQDVAGFGGGGGITIGDAVSGGTGNNILFVDGSSNLAQNTGFTIDIASQTLAAPNMTTGNFTIVTLTVTNQLQAGDLATSANNTWFTDSADKTVYTYFAHADAGYDYQTPATGFSYTVPDRVYSVILDPAAALAAGTIVLPALPNEGQIVRLKISQSITALTISPNAGQSVLGAPTAYTQGQGAIDCMYRAANTTWYC